MRWWRLRVAMLAAGTAASCLVPALAAQRSPSSASAAVDRRTSWGHPDLQGIWVINQDTPLERADPAIDVPRLAPLAKWFPGGEPSTGGVSGVVLKAGPREALVIDPPTGRIPMRPAAEATRDSMLVHLTDSYENHTLWERCITRGPVLLPSNYNNGYEIIQTPEYVAFRHEMIHEYRIIPIDGRPRLPDTVRQWMGEPRGRWEGNTLVVETTKFRAGAIIASSTKSLALRGIRHSEALRLIERITLSGPDTLSYELTVEDPNTYSQPWKVAFPIDREEDYEIFEYSCHEGNYGLAFSLSGARAQEAGKK